MSIVSITAVTNHVECADGHAEHVFTIRNTTGGPLRIGSKVLVDTPAQSEWLQIDGPAERDLGENAADQLTVRIHVGDDVPSGQYTYRLLIFSTRSPGEQFTEGETVAFEVPQRATASVKKSPARCSWCIPVAIAAGVLLLGGLGLWWFWPETEETPTVATPATEIEPRILSFDASPARIQKGQPTRLRWATEHASRVEISGIGPVPLSGSQTLSPERSSRYQLVAVNDEGVKVERLLRIEVESATSRQLRGVYTIQQKSNNRYMDAHEGSNDNSVVTRDRQNNDTQRWILTPLGDNAYTIQQKSNGQYVDAHEGKEDNSVVTRDKQNNTTQSWILRPSGNNTYTIQQKSNGRYMDAHEGKNDNSVVTRDRQNNDTQRWIVKPL